MLICTNRTDSLAFSLAQEIQPFVGLYTVLCFLYLFPLSISFISFRWQCFARQSKKLSIAAIQFQRVQKPQRYKQLAKTSPIGHRNVELFADGLQASQLNRAVLDRLREGEFDSIYDQGMRACGA